MSAFRSDRPPLPSPMDHETERQTSDPGTGEATAQRSMLLRDCMSDEEKEGGLVQAPASRFHTIHFFCGNPTVELTFGVMELFRRWRRLGNAAGGGGNTAGSGSSGGGGGGGGGVGGVSSGDGSDNEESTAGTTRLVEGGGSPGGRSPARPPSKLLCILSVPVHMSAADFCQFTGSFGKDIIRMLMLCDALPDKYMVVLQFASQSKADEFFDARNYKRFNSLEVRPPSFRSFRSFHSFRSFRSFVGT